MKVGDLIRRKFFGHYQKTRMKSFDPSFSFNPEQFYIVTKLDEENGMIQILDTETGEVEVIPDSSDYYEVISENR